MDSQSAATSKLNVFDCTEVWIDYPTTYIHPVINATDDRKYKGNQLVFILFPSILLALFATF